MIQSQSQSQSSSSPSSSSHSPSSSSLSPSPSSSSPSPSPAPSPFPSSSPNSTPSPLVSVTPTLSSSSSCSPLITPPLSPSLPLPLPLPFSHFSIQSTQPLHDREIIASKDPCFRCKKPGKLYCYQCNILLDKSLQLPNLPTLPLPLDIIRDHREKLGKSTACHAKVLSPNCVNIYSPLDTKDYPEEYHTHPEKCLLLFPTKDAVSISTLNLSEYSRLVVLDGTWKQCLSRIYKEPIWSPFQKVTLSQPQTTLFWRFQSLGIGHLSTIEAIYYILRDLWKAQHGSYSGELDNILFLFKYHYELIQGFYNKTGKRFTNRLVGSHSYIRSNVYKPGGESKCKEKKSFMLE